MKTLVIHHSADFDGIFCREIARKHLGTYAEYVGWDYGDPLPVVASDVERIYMLDISINGMMDDPRLIWIDHHKSAMEKFSAKIYGYRVDGVAACRLAWQWFNKRPSAQEGTPLGMMPHEWSLPDRQQFVDRNVMEPYAVRLAGEYDIWDKRDPNAELFQHGLRSQDLTDYWQWILADRRIVPIAEVEGMINVGHPIDLAPDGTVDPTVPYVDGLLKAGRAIQFSMRESAKNTCRGSAFEIQWEGLLFLALNSGGNSLTFASAEQPHHDGLLMFRWAANKWRVSLYHSQAHRERDLSQIAVKYGGGGHRGACGFECHELPFKLPGTTDWQAIAREFSNNMEYYRGLVDRCAGPFGDAAYTCDDGSRSDSVLRAKVPELVESMADEFRAMKGGQK